MEETGTYVTNVNSLWAESSSSLRLRDNLTLTRKGTFLEQTQIIATFLNIQQYIFQYARFLKQQI